MLIRHILEGALAQHGDQEVVYRDQTRMTYAQLGERVHRLSSALSGLGVVPGTVVAMLDWDSHRYLEGYFAVPMMGAVLQTVNLRLSSEQLIHCLAGSEAEVILVHRDFAGAIEHLLDRLPMVRVVVVIADGQDMPAGRHDYEAMLAAAAPAFPFEDFDENALATTFHTTGTTGLPKAVSFSHRQIVLQALALMATLAAQPDGQALRRDSVYMPLTPMFHVHAWGVPFVATMLGVKHVYPGRYDPRLILQLQRQERVSFSHCVPTVLQMILEAAQAGQQSILGPWAMVIGGSVLTSSLRRAAEAAGITAFAGYGMSETGPATCIARTSGTSAEVDVDLRRAGYPLPLVQTAIIDDSMRQLPWDGASAGELVVRSPWLTASYAGDEAASQALWTGGWLHTQDLATIDAHGAVTIQDRIKDVIKTGGEWVVPSDLEELLLLHPSVGEAAVIAIPDDRWGERPFAFVVSTAGERDASTLRMHLSTFVDSGRLTRMALPEGFAFLTSLPRTSVGKIDKRGLRATFDNDGSQATT
ncbi:MAG: long-chain-fatty-acid--CoA ligase [Sphingomonas sp.]|uniref:long-chain-fatty-acid--CoA ligase n=1 Tax=Sphingomonas sp. TaxID=28214 RepID=UPI0035625AF9